MLGAGTCILSFGGFLLLIPVILTDETAWKFASRRAARRSRRLSRSSGCALFEFCLKDIKNSRGCLIAKRIDEEIQPDNVFQLKEFLRPEKNPVGKCIDEVAICK